MVYSFVTGLPLDLQALIMGHSLEKAMKAMKVDA
jgi:hypothetical protein